MNQIFTPPEKSDSFKQHHRRSRSQRAMENDSTSSPKPLCSNLENERIRLLYEKDDINLIDIDQIQRTKLDYKHINNENSTFAVKSHTLNDDSEKISYNDVSPLTISSQASINRRVASKNNGNKENYKTSQPEDSNCLESSSNNPHCKNDEPLSENNQEYDKLNNTDQNFDHYLQESKDNEEDESDEQVDGNFSEPYQNLIKNAYLVHSQYLSGITEKSDEESHITNKMYQNS